MFRACSHFGESRNLTEPQAARMPGSAEAQPRAGAGIGDPNQHQEEDGELPLEEQSTGAATSSPVTTQSAIRELYPA